MFRLIYRAVITEVKTYLYFSPRLQSGLGINDLDGVASGGGRASVYVVLAVAVEHKCANVLGDDLSRLAFELD